MLAVELGDANMLLFIAAAAAAIILAPAWPKLCCGVMSVLGVLLVPPPMLVAVLKMRRRLDTALTPPGGVGLGLVPLPLVRFRACGSRGAFMYCIPPAVPPAVPPGVAAPGVLAPKLAMKAAMAPGSLDTDMLLRCCATMRYELRRALRFWMTCNAELADCVEHAP